MSEQIVQRLRRIRADVVGEIDMASRRCDMTAVAAAGKARDALNEMLILAVDEAAARCEEKHASLDEMNAMAPSGYSGIGCPNCGRDADVEGNGVEIGDAGAVQEVSCGQCDKTWINRYRFECTEA